MNLIRNLNESSGMTVVLVTHEAAIAEKYTARMISLADGKVVSDIRNAKSAVPRGDA
jgi:ABC-type phosphate/phosphonate transport system ATPase subunit